ncbi:MAG: glycosyltransferase [Ruminococcus sp.]|nr:glycosyltransferase [Ruminococcus sp.]
MFIEDLNVNNILFADASTDKFWYVLYQDETLAGCIGSREYVQICETKRIVLKKDFLYIYAGEEEKQTAIEIFMANKKIRKLPVLDKNQKLLYEYVRSAEAYFEDLDIQCGINKEKEQKNLQQEKIIVSMTSYGRRLDLVHIAIKSIMVQTMKADEIVLYLATEDSQRKIKQEEELIKAGLRIERNVEDLKAHKKYFYAMQEYQDDLIITIDDDTIYDDRLLEDLYSGHLKYPDAVICRRGHRMTKKDGKIASYSQWEGCVESVAPEKGVCATGVGGVLYPCGKYREAFLDAKGIRESAFYGDDLWLKTIELIWKINTYAIGELPVRVIEGSQKDALYMENADNKRNDEYLLKLERYFHINLADLF